MKRILVVLLFAGLVLAPAAGAKGPHAVLSSDGDAVEAGEAWDVTLEMMETKAPGQPTLLARKDDRMVATRGRRVWSDGFATRYRLRVVLPADGRWKLRVVDGKRDFRFPSVAVGSGRAPVDYVAFPQGSQAQRQGVGGPFDMPETPAGSRAEPLAPEVVQIANSGPPDDDGDGSGIPFWILPAAGLVLAGAGVWRLRSR